MSINNTDFIVKSSRGTDIHASIMLPDTKDAPIPFVFLFHGFLGNRHEYGLYHGGVFDSKGMATELANVGLASVRLDFPGSGDSTESFEAYTLTNMVDDADKVYTRVLNNFNVDANRVGILGWSMGARVTSMFIHTHPEIDTVLLWAPAIQNGNGDLQFLKESSIYAGKPEIDQAEYANKLRDEATTNGKAFIEQDFSDRDVYISPEFFKEIDESTPMDWIKEYKGDMLVVLPLHDSVIPKSTYDTFCNETDIKRVFIDCDHDLGIEDDDPVTTYSIMEISADYLQRHLRKSC